MIKNMLNKVVDKQDLSHEEMKDAMDIIMSGGATPAQISGFITALRMKGETVDEISGAASVMREKATKISPKLPNGGILIDTCGTGGDGSQTFNISTAAALVAAGGGAYIAKHGNRAVSSKCGSADVLEALGINISIPPSRVESCIEEVGIGFLFAPLLHGAMKNAIGPRKELGIRTIFNILGPLTNPATASGQLLGVYDPNLCEVMARVLAVLGSKEAIVVHGDGHDEITTTGKTKISHLKDEKISNYTIEPEQFGMSRASREELSGGDPEHNAEIIENILDGEPGPRTDVVILNAAAGLMVSGIVSDFESAIELARESVKSGRAKKKLADLKEFTNNVKEDA
jgi:anthranilate phosphoribosyltransferase